MLFRVQRATLVLVVTALGCSSAATPPPPTEPGFAADSPARAVDPFIGVHGAAFRFFARKANTTILVDAARSLSWNGNDARVHVVSHREVEGDARTGGFCVEPNQQHVYFVARFDRDASAAGTWLHDAPSDAA